MRPCISIRGSVRRSKGNTKISRHSFWGFLLSLIQRGHINWTSLGLVSIYVGRLVDAVMQWRKKVQQSQIVRPSTDRPKWGWSFFEGSLACTFFNCFVVMLLSMKMFSFVSLWKQVTRGHNIFAEGWAGATNPHLHPTSIHKKASKMPVSPLFDWSP